MFFYRNKNVLIDLGTGNSNKLLYAMPDRKQMIEMIDLVYKGAIKGQCSSVRRIIMKLLWG